MQKGTDTVTCETGVESVGVSQAPFRLHINLSVDPRSAAVLQCVVLGLQLSNIFSLEYSVDFFHR